MVEIRYGEHYEIADLTGKSVAQAREQYKPEFGIPDKAQASLNGKGIKQKHEPVTALGDNDSLTFAQKSRKGLFFIGTILLALAITGGIFAYGATTATVTLTVTGTTDFAAVTPAGPPSFDVFGSYRGKIPTDAGDLFTITPDGNFTGDMVAILTLTNAADLSQTYRILVMEIEVWDSAGTPDVKVDGPVYLTLGKGEVSLDIDQTGFTAPYDIRLVGGFYITHRGGWSTGDEDPTILCDVIQWGSS